MPGKSLQTLAHIDEYLNLFVGFVELSQLRIGLERPVYRDIQLVGDHFGDTVHIGIGQIHYPSHVPDYPLGRHGTEGHDLNHLLGTVLLSHIINDLLPSFKAEVNVDIGHGYTLGIQETFKQQVIFNRIDIGDFQAIGYDASCRRSSSRPHHDIITLGIINKIPYNEEIIHVTHAPDNIQFIIQPLLQRAVILRITFLQTVAAELIQITPGIIPRRHLKMGQLRHAELDVHVTAVGDILGVFHSFPGIREQPFHFFLALYIILAALIPHPVLIRQLFSRLDTQQDIMGFFILPVSVMYVVSGYQRDIQLLAHGKEGRIYRTLVWDPMILQLQIIVPFSEAVLVLQRRLLGFVNQTFLDITGHLACQAGRKGNDAFMVTVQHLHIHPGLVIIAFGEALAHDFHQVCITGIVFRQQHQMIIPVIPARQLFIKAGVGGHINLAAYNRLNPRFLGGPVEINNTVHNAVIRDGGAVHPQLFYPFHIFFYLIRPVQQTVFRMDVKMCKCHVSGTPFPDKHALVFFHAEALLEPVAFT